jgi:hypothetical protein
MDWRLRDSPDLRIMITELLEVLERHLSRMFPQPLIACLIEEIARDNIPCVLVLSIAGPAHDVSSPFHKPADRKYGQPLTSPSTSSSSSSSSYTSSSSLDPIITASSLLLQSQHAVEATLDRLFLVSSIIRKSALENRFAKAAAFIEFDKDGANLTQAFKDLALQIVQHQFPNAGEVLQKRLAETISLRQRQLAYSKNHHRHYSSIPSPSREHEHQDILAKKAHNQAPVRPKLARSVAERSQTALTIVSPSVVFTQSSASAIPRLTRKDFSSKASSVVSAVPVQEGALHLPAPPKPPPGTKELQCPYCFIVQPINVFEERKWR